MVPVCDKRYHIYNRFRHFWAEIKKLWNYPLLCVFSTLSALVEPEGCGRLPDDEFCKENSLASLAIHK